MTAEEFYERHYMKMLNIPQIMEAYAEQFKVAAGNYEDLYEFQKLRIRELEETLSGLLDIIYSSQGVSGYHLSGAVAEWDEFEEVSKAQQTLKKD